MEMLSTKLWLLLFASVTFVRSSGLYDEYVYEDYGSDSDEREEGESDEVPEEMHPLSDAMINHINDIQSNWTVRVFKALKIQNLYTKCKFSLFLRQAGRNFDPSIEWGYIRRLMGVLPGWEHHRLPERRHRIEGLYIPKEFDSRKKWTHCPSLNEIRDQGNL